MLLMLGVTSFLAERFEGKLFTTLVNAGGTLNKYIITAEYIYYGIAVMCIAINLILLRVSEWNGFISVIDAINWPNYLIILVLNVIIYTNLRLIFGNKTDGIANFIIVVLAFISSYGLLPNLFSYIEIISNSLFAGICALLAVVLLSLL